MPSALRPLVLCAGLLLGGAVRADPKLAATSPFLPPDGTAAGAAETAPLELRGILRDAAGYRFSIFDPVRKSGQWVRLNEPGHDFVVRTHDVARDAVTLDFQGRTLALSLRAAKVVGLSASAAAPGGGPPYPAGPPPTAGPARAGPGAPPPTPEEQARFNRAVQEINRRRAARERGMAPAPK